MPPASMRSRSSCTCTGNMQADTRLGGRAGMEASRQAGKLLGGWDAVKQVSGKGGSFASRDAGSPGPCHKHLHRAHPPHNPPTSPSPSRICHTRPPRPPTRALQSVGWLAK